MPKKLNHTLNELMVLGALMSSFSGSTLVLADSINQHMESFKKLAQNIKIFYKNKGQKIAINQQTKINQNNPWITINSTESQFLLLPADNKTFVQYESGQTTVVPDIITLNHNKKHLYYKIQLEKGTNQLQLIGQKSDPIKGLLFNNKSQFNSQVNLGRYEPNNLSQTDQRLVKKLSSQQQTTLIKGNLNFKFPKLPQSITASLTQPQTSTAENSQNTSKTDLVKNNSTEKADDHKSKTVKKSAAATKKSTIKKQPTAIIKKKIVKKITAKVQKNSRSNSPKENLSKSTKTTTKKATKAVIKKNKSVQSKTKTAVKRSQPAKVYSVKRSLLPDMAVSPFKAQTKSASPLMAALALPDATTTSVTPSSGTYGTSKWSINSSGVLTIGAGTFPDNNENAPWISNSDITKIVITGKAILGNDASDLFYMDKNVQSIEGISNLDTSHVTNMYQMFFGLYKLSGILDLSGFDTKNVTSMEMMFEGDFSLTNLNVSSFDTSNVTNMHSMFSSVSGITSLDLSNFNTSKVTDISNMFAQCTKLVTLNISNFDTGNVTNMSQMFYYDTVLPQVDVSKFNTDNVQDFSFMFQDDYDLEKLDLSNWNMVNASDESDMFDGLYSLSVLKLGPTIRFFSDSPSGLASPSGQTNWQEVGADSGGTISNPQGTVYSPSDLNSLFTYTGITKDETFVPERGSFERKMTLSQTVSPTSIQKGKTASFTATMDNVSTLKQGYQDATLNFGTCTIGSQASLLNSSIKDYDGNTVDPGNNLKYVTSFTNAGVSGDSIQMTVLDANGNNASKYFSLNNPFGNTSANDFQLASSPDTPAGTYYIVTAYSNNEGNLQTSFGTINLISGYLISDYNPAGNTSTSASNAAVQSGIESMTKNITPNKPDTTLQNVNFNEALPTGLTNVTNIKVNGSSTSLLTYDSSNNTISGNLGSLGNSDKNVVTFDATPNMAGNLTATANVTFDPSIDADQVSANATLTSYDIVDTNDQNISMPDRSNETNTLDLNTALNGKTFDFSSGSIYFEADKDDPGLSHQANKVVGLDSSDIQVSYNGQFVGDDADDSVILADGSNQKIEFNLTDSGKAKLLANNTVKFYLVMTDGNRTYEIPVVLSEPISTWMPDTNLQQAAYNGLIKQGKSIDSISSMQKADINQLNDLTNTVDSAGDNKIKDLTGLEYANILTSINLDGNDLGANQTNNEAIIAKLTTLESLNVSNNSLTGSLDPDWSNLKDLGRLQADNNSLSGKLPSSYSNLTNLIDLSAYNNQLSGTLTNDYFANMKGLRSVNLSNNQFTGQVPEFSYNDKLQSLALNYNQLTGSLPDFSSSKQDLSSIQVSNNQLTGTLPDNWSNLPAISYIDVSNNQLTGTLPNSWIANMPDLSSLYLDNNTGLAVPLADWTNWTKLKILDLGRDELSGSLPTSWGTNKPDLTVVYLGSGKGITGSIPDSWGSLSNLTVLDIGDNQISGNVPDSFYKLTNLKNFQYGENHITSSLKGTNSSGNYQTVKVDPSQWKREGDNLVLPYSAFYNGQTGSTNTQYQNMGWKQMDGSGAPYTLDNNKQEVVLNLKDYLKTWNAGKTVGIEFFIYDQDGSTAVNPTNMNYSSQIDAPVVLPTDFGSLNVNLSAHDSGANLKDGQFKIYDANGNEVTTNYNGYDIWESTTNSSGGYGALQIYLPDGDYTVVETKAPDGYELSKKSYQVTIQSGQSVDVNVINDKQTGLPLAGSSIMPWIISGLVEAALIGAGWYLSKRRRKPEK